MLLASCAGVSHGQANPALRYLSFVDLCSSLSTVVNYGAAVPLGVCSVVPSCHLKASLLAWDRKRRSTAPCLLKHANAVDTPPNSAVRGVAVAQ
jgi:hypothetical protein